MLASNLKNIFGPKFIDLCVEYQVKVDETELYRKGQTREQICALITNEYRVLEKIFLFKNSSHTNSFDHEEQKVINEKEFNKNKRITTIIKMLLNKRLLEEALTIYVSQEIIKFLLAEAKASTAEKEAKRYAEQVAIFETENGRIEEQLRVLLEAELARSYEVIKDIYSRIESHKETINIITKKLEDLTLLEHAYIEKHSDELSKKLTTLFPKLDEDIAKKLSNETLAKHHEIEKRIIINEARIKLNDKLLARDVVKLQALNSKIESIKLRIVDLANQEKFEQDSITTHFKTKLPITEKRLEHVKDIHKNNQQIISLFGQLRQQQAGKTKLSTSINEREQQNKKLSIINDNDKKLNESFNSDLIHKCGEAINMPTNKIEEICAKHKDILSEYLIDYENRKAWVAEKYDAVEQIHLERENIDIKNQEIQDSEENISILLGKQESNKENISTDNLAEDVDDFLNDLMKPETTEVKNTITPS